MKTEATIWEGFERVGTFAGNTHLVLENNEVVCPEVKDDPTPFKVMAVLLVRSALAASCEACRAAVGVGPFGQVGCELRPPLAAYEPAPYPGAETMLAEKQACDAAYPTVTSAVDAAAAPDAKD